MLVNHHLKSLPCYVVGPAICNTRSCVPQHQADARHPCYGSYQVIPPSHPARESVTKHHALKPIQSLAPPHGGEGYWQKAYQMLMWDSRHGGYCIWSNASKGVQPPQLSLYSSFSGPQTDPQARKSLPLCCQTAFPQSPSGQIHPSSLVSSRFQAP